MIKQIVNLLSIIHIKAVNLIALEKKAVFKNNRVFAGTLVFANKKNTIRTMIIMQWQSLERKSHRITKAHRVTKLYQVHRPCIARMCPSLHLPKWSRRSIYIHEMKKKAAHCANQGTQHWTLWNASCIYLLTLGTHAHARARARIRSYTCMHALLDRASWWRLIRNVERKVSEAWRDS